MRPAVSRRVASPIPESPRHPWEMALGGSLHGMKISPTKQYAVLTGDIIGSSKLPKSQRQGLPGSIKRAARATQKAFSESVPLDIDVFRGDSWQLLVTDPMRSVRVAFHLRCCLRAEAGSGRGVDTRIGIGSGPVDFVPKNRVSEGDGEAYRSSGRALEALGVGRGNVSVGFAGAGEDIRVILRLMDALAQRWTARQAQAVAGALRGWTHEKIAAQWTEPISQQAVTKHLASAQWAAFEDGLRHIEAGLGTSAAPDNT